MIPIARPFLGEEEAAAARDVILSGWVTQGPRVKQFEDAFSFYVGSKYACAVSSCTTALHLALLAAGVKPGDVVITASHSFIATANSIRHSGAEPIFVDIDPLTYNLSPEKLAAFIEEECDEHGGELFYRNASGISCGESPLVNVSGIKGGRIGRVSAIMPVHQMGMPCDIGGIIRIANKYGLPVIEDAACATGSEILMDGKWERIGKPHGDIACFSFHPRKVITTGDGGMLTTNNAAHDKMFRLLRQHGMSVPDTVRHSAKKVILEDYVTTGFNYRMTDIQAAIGIEQLKKLDEILKGRAEIDRLYREQLGDLKWLDLPKRPDNARPNWQSYPVRVLENAPGSRDMLMQRLLDNGISTRTGIMNAHSEPPYSNWKSSLPESERARQSVILLPVYHGLEGKSVRRITGLIRNFGKA